jgi:hypothetical protein
MSISEFSRNSFSIEEICVRNTWSRNRVYHLIAVGILKSYKSGKRRFVSRRAEEEAIRRLEEMTEAGG